MSSSLFVDTSGWASLFVNTQTFYPQADQHFRLALQQHKAIITTNYVIAELVDKSLTGHDMSLCFY